METNLVELNRQDIIFAKIILVVGLYKDYKNGYR